MSLIPSTLYLCEFRLRGFVIPRPLLVLLDHCGHTISRHPAKRQERKFLHNVACPKGRAV
jgi:hypothetical protein